MSTSDDNNPIVGDYEALSGERLQSALRTAYGVARNTGSTDQDTPFACHDMDCVDNIPKDCQAADSDCVVSDRDCVDNIKNDD